MKITKKQIWAFVTALIVGLPLSFYFGGRGIKIGYNTLKKELNTKGRELEKYKVESFSTLDSLKKDTLIVKSGEIYTDTLIDYYSISKQDLEFRTFSSNYGGVLGWLSVKNKIVSRYKTLENGVLSEEIIKKNNETILYHLAEDLTGKNFKINQFELHISKPEVTPLNISTKNLPINEIYKRDSEKGKRILDSLETEPNKYLSRIKKHKIAKGIWKD